MPDNAIVLLDALLAERDRLRGGDPLPVDLAFELFAFEQCLKEGDLSDEEIANGQVGGGDDGGVDGLYCFLNGNLLEEDAEVLLDGYDATSVRREAELVLFVIQGRTTASFGETPFEKLAVTLTACLDLTKTDEELGALFSEAIVARFSIFRIAWQRLATRHPKIAVRVYYATKGDTGNVHEKVETRADLLVKQITTDVPKASATVDLLGARELVELAGREKSYTLELTFQENATARDSHIALVTLDDLPFVARKWPKPSRHRAECDPVTIVAIVRVGREREIHAKAPPPAVLAAHAFAGKVDGMGSCGSTRMRKRACGPRCTRISARTGRSPLSSPPR